MAEVSPWDKHVLQQHFGGFWRRIFLDLTNQLRCFEQIERHEARPGGSPYNVIGHVRLDVVLLGVLPAHVLFELQAAVSSPSRRNIAWVPFGDDHGGIIDMMAIATRPAAQVLRGVRGNASRWVHQHALARQSRPFFYPESITRAQLQEHRTTVRRFGWRHCRVSDAGHCRYPGEMQRLLRGRFGAPIAYNEMLCKTCNHRRLICDGVLRHLAANRVNAVTQAQTTCCEALMAPAPSWANNATLGKSQCTPPILDTWKGGQECSRWDDDQCCEISAACRQAHMVEWRRLGLALPRGSPFGLSIGVPNITRTGILRRTKVRKLRA